MKINFKARFRNKTFLISLCALLVSAVYHILGIFGIVPIPEQKEIVEISGFIIDILAFLGVVIDPTTDGINDSDRVMTYCTDCDVRLKEAEK